MQYFIYYSDMQIMTGRPYLNETGNNLPSPIVFINYNNNNISNGTEGLHNKS